jgi:hypothetical protein
MWNGNRLGCIISLAPRWTTRIETGPCGRHLLKQAGRIQTSLNLLDIRQVIVKPGCLWSRVILLGQHSELVLEGVWRWHAKEIAKSIEGEVIQDIESRLRGLENELNPLLQGVEGFLTQDRYLRHSDVRRFREAMSPHANATTQAVFDLLEHPYSYWVPFCVTIRERAVRLSEACQPGSSLISCRNGSCVTTVLDVVSSPYDRLSDRRAIR